MYQKDGVRIIIPVFVDDMTLVSKSKSDINSVVTQLEQHFKLRRLSPIDFLLGVKVERERGQKTIHLCQKQYNLDILARYNFSDGSPVSTPLNHGVILTGAQCPSTPEEVEEMRPVPYISAVGSLLYHAVGLLARFNTKPGKAHWAAAKHLFRYLKGTFNPKLSFSADTSTSDTFVGYSDAAHEGDKTEGFSTGAYVVKMGTGAISWRSKIQDVVNTVYN